jgi:polyferredoxin
MLAVAQTIVAAVCVCVARNPRERKFFLVCFLCLVLLSIDMTHFNPREEKRKGKKEKSIAWWGKAKKIPTGLLGFFSFSPSLQVGATLDPSLRNRKASIA